MKPRTRTVVLVLLLLLAVLWLFTPGKLRGTVQSPSLPAALDDWIAQSEQRVDREYGLVAGTEKRITWADAAAPTDYAVLYLHGFSATRQETHPLASTVAAALGANLFETRLKGHGRQRAALADVRAEDWLQDGVEALAIAAALGRRVVVIGTSTGATLAAALLDHPLMQSVDTIVMLSPNFGLKDGGGTWATGPAGSLIIRAMAGNTRRWEPYNELQGRYWSTSYPTAALVEMMRLVDFANSKVPATIPQRLLMFYSPDDQIVSVAQAFDVYEGTSAPLKLAVAITDPGDPSHHVLAGDVLSAANTARVADTIIDFVRLPAP